MTQQKDTSRENLRERVHSLLTFLTPTEAKILRARFGIDESFEENVEDEVLEAMARELAIMKKKKKK